MNFACQQLKRKFLVWSDAFHDKVNDFLDTAIGGVNQRGIGGLLEGAYHFGSVGGVALQQRINGFMAAAPGIYPAHALLRITAKMKLVGSIGKHSGGNIATFHDYAMFIGIIALQSQNFITYRRMARNHGDLLIDIFKMKFAGYILGVNAHHRAARKLTLDGGQVGCV